MMKFALAGLIAFGTMSAAVAMPTTKLSVAPALPIAKTVVVVKKTVVRRKPVVIVPRRKPAVVVKKTIVR